MKENYLENIKDIWERNGKSYFVTAAEFAQLYGFHAARTDELQSINDELKEELKHWKSRALAAEKQRKPL